MRLMYATLKRSHTIGVTFLAKYIGRLNDCFIDHVYLFFVCLFVCLFVSSFFHLVFFSCYCSTSYYCYCLLLLLLLLLLLFLLLLLLLLFE